MDAQSARHLTLHEEMKDFFARYVDAFERKDADAVSDLWDPVGLFPLPSGNFSMERQDFRDHCAKLMAFYQKQGVVTPVGELLSCTELFPNVAEARMGYSMFGERGELIAKWDHVYILRQNNHWSVSLTIADGEMAAWTALGAQF